MPYLARLAPGIAILPKHGWGLPDADLLVYGGGTQFFSYPSTMRGATLIRRAGKLASSPTRLRDHLLRRARPLERAFKRRAALGIGLGPFVPASFEERSARELMRSCEFVTVRDRTSEALCRRWGISHAIHGSDLCFLPESWGRPESASCASRSDQYKIAIIVRDWRHGGDEGERYLQPIFDSVRLIARDNVSVTFVLFDASDHHSRRILEERGASPLCWDPVRDSIPSFVARLEEFDLFVTARYHGAVLAALFGKPAICVDLDPKLALLAESLSYAPALRPYLWSSPFDPEDLCRLLRDILGNLASMRPSIEAAVTRHVERTRKMLAAFTEFIHSTHR